FAPTRLYGRPDDFRRFVDRAHSLGVAVILDVVYNHFGPEGNYLRYFSQTYVTDRYPNEWGDAVNFDGPDAGPVREFFLANADYCGDPREFVAAAKHGFLYQGQHYLWQGKRRGTPALDLPAEAFVVFLQNHDQVANSGAGRRGQFLTSPGRWRAMTAWLLLMPGIPMLLQGQEFAASTPFLYFADHQGGLAQAVRDGRREFLAQFPS